MTNHAKINLPFTEIQSVGISSKLLKLLNKNLWPILIFIFGTLYISNTWSPSSYAYILVDHLGAKEAGPDFGKPRGIRSDEWAVNTALIQSMDRNDFKRFNESSFYNEDLRMNYGLPIHDWGIIFKPTMWLYGIVPSAYAYSFHWYAVMVIFLAGYAILFKKIKLPAHISILLSFSIFFTGQVQFWWNEKGPIFALFPWIFLILTWRTKHILFKTLLFYWLSTTWLLTNLYPPIQISLAFVTAIMIWAYFPEEIKWKNIIIYMLAALASAATAAYYLQDYLALTASTIYPGSRISTGGGANGAHFLSWWFPAILFDHKYNTFIPNSNICEIGTLGIYYTFFTSIFLDYRNIRTLSSERSILIILTGFLVMATWMYLPLPSWAGLPLLWNHVPGNRMEFAAGLLWILLVVHISFKMGLQWSTERAAILLLGLILVAAFNPNLFGINANQLKYVPLQNFLIVPIVALALSIYRWRYTSHALQTTLLSISLVVGVIFFGRFNPLQSAQPIFSVPETPMLKAMRDSYSINNNLFIHQIGLGATANGLGFRSVPHINPVPHMDIWKKYFPDLTDSERNDIFNRYAHIYIDDVQKPEIKFLDAVKIPATPFQHPWQVSIHSQKHIPDNQTKNPIGYIDKITYRENEIVISGWGGWQDMSPQRVLEVYTSEPTISAHVSYHLRGDLVKHSEYARFGANGFHLVLQGNLPKKLTHLCLVAHDSTTGHSWPIHNAADITGCNMNKVAQ